jgi:indolepyruvate ferredoxin oxidoreductase beta subunit
MMTGTTNVILCGTGGQGILLASEVLCAAAWKSGFDVKKSEVHGMAQRGGSVSSHVRFGAKVHSVLVEAGTADIILALEKMEGLRWAHYLSPRGRLISADIRINPMTVNTGAAEYPDVDLLVTASSIPCTEVPVLSIARDLNNFKVVNVALLGAASSLIPGISADRWEAAIAERVPPKALEVNMEAFRRGRAVPHQEVKA